VNKDHLGALIQSEKSIASSSPMTTESESQIDFVEPQDLKQKTLEIVDTTLTSNEVINSTYELFIPFVIITVILGGLTVYFLYKFLKKSK